MRVGYLVKSRRITLASSEVSLIPVNCGKQDPCATESTAVDAAGFATKATDGHHLPEERAGPVFRAGETVVHGLHDR